MTMTSVSSAAIERLNVALKLPATGREQDWDIELADPDRLSDFVAYYETADLCAQQRVALMALIIASLDDLLAIGSIETALWKRIARLIGIDLSLHLETLSYWVQGSTKPTGDDFMVAEYLYPLFRKAREEST